MSTTLGRKGLARRDDILHLARKLLVDDGLARFVLRDVATAAGMKLGNLQYYFRTREDLLDAVMRAEFDANLRGIRERSDEDGDSHKQIAELAVTLIDEWTGQGGRVYAALALLALHERRFRRLYKEIYQSFYNELAAILRRFNPDAGPQELLEKARLITALMDGTVQQVRIQGRGPKSTDRAQLLRNVGDLIVSIAER